MAVPLKNLLSKRFAILAISNPGKTAQRFTVHGGQVDIPLAKIPKDVNGEDWVIREVLTPTNNPCIFDAEYSFEQAGEVV